MPIVLAAGLGAGAVVWIWGALTGRLASMIAAVISPSWVNAPSGVPTVQGSIGTATAEGVTISSDQQAEAILSDPKSTAAQKASAAAYLYASAGAAGTSGPFSG